MKRFDSANDGKIRFGVGLAIAGLGLVLTGCGGGPSADSGTPTAATAKPINLQLKSEAGVPVTQDTDKAPLVKLYASSASKYGPARKDPFALTKSETEFETEQTGQNAFIIDGGWQTDYVPNPPPEIVPYIQEQPYRRLAGVVVGDSVLAIIEMGDGSEPQIVRPGEKIPGTEWTVVSIDQEKAVLHRDGNVLPNDVTVRLETPRPGTPGYNAGGGPGAGAGFPGGFPGAPGGPGGPGGPGFRGPGAPGFRGPGGGK